MSGYIVTGPAAVVIIAGRRRYLDRDDIVPAGADQARIDHLLDVGLIAALPEPEPADAGPDADPGPDGDAGSGDADGEAPTDGDDAGDQLLADLDLAGLRALAAERGVDLQGATRKADIIAALEAAE